jgi:hypothetical protein
MFSEIKAKAVQTFANPNSMLVLRVAILTLLAIGMLLFPEAALADPARGGTGS